MAARISQHKIVTKKFIVIHAFYSYFIAVASTVFKISYNLIFLNLKKHL